MKIEQRFQNIKLILSDVDGALTDGGITFDNQGIESKRFHVRDGMGIKLWQKAGGIFGLLTARSSHIVKVRAAELGVELIRQGFSDKLPVAIQIAQELNLEFKQICYVGDDLTDIALLKQCGLAVAVADAAKEVRDAAHLITKLAGGQGAMRELIETILKSQGTWNELVQNFSRQ